MIKKDDGSNNNYIPTWYQTPHEDVVLIQKSNTVLGLSQEEAKQRCHRHGLNVLEEAQGRSPVKILAEQFTDFLVLILIGAAIIAGLLGEPEDLVVILSIVLLNGALGFIQDYRAERAMQALKKLSAPHARVMRGGKVIDVPAFEIVPGDIIILEAGCIVPADIRLLEVHQLRIDESLLTGESVPIDKTVSAIKGANVQIGDQINMAFKGSIVTNGRGVGVVVSTGMQTELGKIANLLKEEVIVKTPLQVRLGVFAKKIALVVLVVCIVIFAIGIMRGEPPVLMFLTALSLAVAAIPEALPAVITVALAIGARRMSQVAALIRKLPAVEALGSVTYICSDKTGTLTQNKMQAVAFYSGSDYFYAKDYIGTLPLNIKEDNWRFFFEIITLNNDAVPTGLHDFSGDPTEAAMLAAASEFGIKKSDLEARLPRIAELPFSAERGCMTSVHRFGDKRIVFSKGAPEVILPLCKNKVEKNGIKVFALDNEMARVEEMTHEGMRVLALGMKVIDSQSENLDLKSLESELSFVGLIGLQDPPREEVENSIALCRSAGIHVIMITGDHPHTAHAIARKLGIAEEDLTQVISGTELSRISDIELKERIHQLRVFARVQPEQKIRIVKTLQELGEVVAMTGDGVNDGPALKAANIGVAMGKSGTDVAREASHMILLDDNFASIVKAVREGRRIYDNIRKFVRFALSGNSGEVWTLFLAPFFALPTPLLPIQILWVNLVTDGLPGLALALEKEESKIMSRPPRPPNESIFSHGLWQHALWVGLLIGALTLSSMAWAYHTGSSNWQTVAFTCLTFSQMAHVLAIRSERQSLFRLGLFSNPGLLASIVGTMALQLLITYHPLMNRIFKTSPISNFELLLCLMSAIIVFVAVELEKFFKFYGKTH